MKPIVKIVIFIGLLLLIIAVCTYGYLTYKEGFQAGSNSGSFCTANANMCAPTCWSKTNPDPNALALETSDETAAYDLYEYYNLESLNITLPPQTTALTAYNMASALSSFDEGAPIPWDYDNMSLDPQFVLRGAVHAAASQGLYNTAYTRAIFSSANSSDFIRSDTSAPTLIATQFYGLPTPTGMSAQTIQFINGTQTVGAMVSTQQGINEIGGILGHDPARDTAALNKKASIRNYMKANPTKPMMKYPHFMTNRHWGELKMRLMHLKREQRRDY